MSIKIENLTKKFGAYTALDNVSVEVGSGELLALLGPSGCGKTTLLRVIAGLETPDTGTVLLGGEDIAARRAKNQSVGFVFQHYALFPHMSVFDNVAFGLSVQKSNQRPSKNEIKERVMELLTMVQMDWAVKRLPSQLSGGQRQRIALARALAVKPKVLLLDEPFSALDAKVRLELRRWLRKLHEELHITSVFVTHDQEEAMELADRVVIINKGKIEQQGSPEAVYDNPANAFVYNFLGNVNVFQGRFAQHDKAGSVFVRPHNIEVALLSGGSDWLPVTIEALRLRGGIVNLELISADGETPLEAEISRDRVRELQLARGQDVFVRFKESAFFEDLEYVI